MDWQNCPSHVELYRPNQNSTGNTLAQLRARLHHVQERRVAEIRWLVGYLGGETQKFEEEMFELVNNYFLIEKLYVLTHVYILVR